MFNQGIVWVLSTLDPPDEQEEPNEPWIFLALVMVPYHQVVIRAANGSGLSFFKP